MGAEVPVYVKVGRLTWEWVEVQAVTLAEASYKATKLPDVVGVLTDTATYERPSATDLRTEGL